MDHERSDAIMSPRPLPFAVFCNNAVPYQTVFTGLTAAAGSFASMLAVRFLFGAGEAGAFPGMARAMFSWIPMQERGLVQGINFSGSRIGAAVTLPVVAALISELGWRPTFVVLMLLGCVWSVVWLLLFRDDPVDANWLGERHTDNVAIEAAVRIENAVAAVLKEGRVRTPDIGGSSSTTEVAQAIANAIE